MARTRAHNLRKSPTQRRAQATVEAILDAAAYILKKDGWERLTTNRIAERAGVNIASLYQYFPNKEAIAAELRRRFSEGTHAGMATAPLPPADQDLRSLVRTGVASALAVIAASPEMHRVFFEELPRRSNPASAMDAEVFRGLPRRLKALMRGVPDTQMAFWIWDKVLDGLVRSACSERPELLTDPVFADEVSLLIERYLIRDG